jgi:hypothetical protein
MSTSAFPCLSSYYYHVLGFHYTPLPTEFSVRHVQTISISIREAFLQLVLPLAYHIYHGFSLLDLISFCMATNLMQLTYFHDTYLLNMTPFCRLTFYTIQHTRSNYCPIKLVF